MADALTITSVGADPRCKLLGRWYGAPGAGQRTGWQASSIEVDFTGTSLSVTLAQKVIDAAAAYLSSIYVYVDGAPALVSGFTATAAGPMYEYPLPNFASYVANSTPQTFLVASGLANARHKARIVFMEGNSYGVMHGLSYSDVTEVSTDGTFNQWVATLPFVGFSGDSISCVANAYENFITCAHPVMVAHGGMAVSGVGVGGGDRVIPPATVAFPWKVMPNYPSTTGAIAATDQPVSAWVSFFGTNDTALGYTAAAYRAAVEAHIAQVRSAQGKPALPFLLVRPMAVNGNNDPLNYGAQLAAIAAADPNVHYYDTSPKWATMTYFDTPHTHPDAAGGQSLGAGVNSMLAPLVPVQTTTSGPWSFDLSLVPTGQKFDLLLADGPQAIDQPVKAAPSYRAARAASSYHGARAVPSYRPVRRST